MDAPIKSEHDGGFAGSPWDPVARAPTLFTAVIPRLVRSMTAA
ncbi:hypothetical protein FHS53_002522 [Xanthobacter tagetidis]|nr:hypothetical protein [Xanthobacter tagetidis]